MKKDLTLQFVRENFSDLLDKLQELSSIEDTLKMKISKDCILIYSILGNEGQVSAMKSFSLSTKDYIEDFKEEGSYDFVLISATKFVKNLKFFDTKKPIKFSITSKLVPDEDNVYQIRTLHLTNGRLKISSIGAELHKIKDLNQNFIETRLNLKKSKWNFTIENEDFISIKKLSTINSEDRTINLNVINKKVYFSEISKWELEVDEVDVPNQHFMFNKKYLSFIDSELEKIKFYIFDNFILLKDDKSNLMLSFEQDFSNDD
jgi:hypothetical protein